MSEKVLLTGATGHLGQNIAARFGAHGIPLRLAVHHHRPLSLLSRWREQGHEIIDLELDKPTSVSRAVEGVSAVIHAAAPNSGRFQTKNLEEVLTESIYRNTRRLFETAYTRGIKKFVFTSSCSTVGLKAPPDRPLNADDWNQSLQHPLTASKARAEKWALLWAAQHEDIQLDCLCLPLILGPGFQKVTLGLEMIERALNGQIVTLPKVAFPIVDSRVAGEAHFQAWRQSRPGGRRWIVAGPYLSSSQMLDLIRSAVGGRNRVLGPAPDAVFQILTAVETVIAKIRGLDPDFGARGLSDFRGADQRVDSAPADHAFDLKHPSAGETMNATLGQMREYLGAQL